MCPLLCPATSWLLPLTSSNNSACAVSTAAFFAVLIVRKRATKPNKRRAKKRRIQPKFLRIALISPVGVKNPTAWHQLLSCGTASDFVVALHFPKELVISRLVPASGSERVRVTFGSPYRTKPKTRGRRCTVSPLDILGLVLWYLKTSGPEYMLGPLFGLIPSSVHDWLDFGMEVVKQVVKRRWRPEFEVRWPSVSEMEASCKLLQANRQLGPLLEGVFGVVDGCRMKCADYEDPDLQNAFWKGFTQSVEVTNIFVFNFFGEIIHAGINYPGSLHDSKIANASGLTSPKLSDSMTPPGNAVLGDSAFGGDVRAARGKILRGRKTNGTSDIPSSVEMATVDIIMQRVLPSERQSAEWGNRALKGPFGRLKLPLSPDSMKKQRLLRVIVHLFNFRTRFVGLNQIRTTYANCDSITQPWLQYYVVQ